MRDFLCCEKWDVFSMKELDKIMAESAKKGKEEQKVVDVALRTIDETFEKLVESSKSFILEGVRTKVDMTEAMDALKKLREIVGDIIPEIKSEKYAKIYIVKYGKEILFS